GLVLSPRTLTVAGLLVEFAGKPVVTPLLSVVAWLVMTAFGGAPGLTWTWKLIAVEALMASVPPLAALAPAPRRKMTSFPAALNWAWSSPAASVFAPALAPETIRSDPGTKWVLAGMGSVSTTLPAASSPVLVTLRLYSRTSPGATEPRLPPLVRSVTVLVVA